MDKVLLIEKDKKEYTWFKNTSFGFQAFITEEIPSKEEWNSDDLALCENNKTKENIQGSSGTSSEDKILANRIHKRRKVKGKKMFLIK